ADTDLLVLDGLTAGTFPAREATTGAAATRGTPLLASPLLGERNDDGARSAEEETGSPAASTSAEIAGGRPPLSPMAKVSSSVSPQATRRVARGEDTIPQRAGADPGALMEEGKAVGGIEGLPLVRAFNPVHLATDADVDAFLDAELPKAEIVVLRLLGGRQSWAHGLDRIAAEAERAGFWLVALPGTDALDPELTALSNVGVPVAHEFAAYLQYGGAENYTHG